MAKRIEQHQQADGDYRTTLESLVSVASRAADIFEGSKIDDQRQLIAFVFSNLRLRGKFPLRSWELAVPPGRECRFRTKLNPGLRGWT